MKLKARGIQNVHIVVKKHRLTCVQEMEFEGGGKNKNAVKIPSQKFTCRFVNTTIWQQLSE